MLIDTIFDYEFKTGERAQYVFNGSDDTEQTIVVQILDSKTVDFEKLYIACAHKDLLKKAYLVGDASLAKTYNLPNTHSAVFLDPDELIPVFRAIWLAADNTRK
jgi:hypothetical protein